MLQHLSSDLDTAMAAAVDRGLMSEGQYRHIADTLRGVSSSSFLVFGVGHDATLWSHCTTGELAFVEDNPHFLTLAPVASRVVLYQFHSRVGQWMNVPEPPVLIDRDWDYVLVDGPSGFAANQPGRQFPIAWARRLAKKSVFVHDYERSWERAVCDKIWGLPQHIVVAEGGARTELAVFDAAAVA